MGHEIIQFNWFLPSSIGYEQWLKRNKREKNNQLIEQVKKTNDHSQIDLFFSTIDDRYIYPDTVEKIKKFGIITINYSCDDVNAFDRIKNLVSIYDYNWTTQLSAIHNYKEKNARCIYTPLGANPNIYKPYDLKKEYDVTFVGRNMGYREELIQMIKNNGINICVWGDGWPHTIKEMVRSFLYTAKMTSGQYLYKQIQNTFWYLSNFKELDKIFGPPLTYEELIKMYSRSRINLNFSGGLDSKMYDYEHANKSMKLRDMETTMSGGFYLTEYSDEIGKLFEIGTEIECFRNKEDLIEKIKYYLNHPNEVESIGKAGRKRALENYTWKKNFENLFEKMSITL